jgi:hypothetical protein
MNPTEKLTGRRGSGESGIERIGTSGNPALLAPESLNGTVEDGGYQKDSGKQTNGNGKFF